MISTEECIRQFIGDYSIRLEDETVDLYQKAVGQLIIYCEKPFGEITSKDIRSWVNYLEPKYKPSTVRTKLAGVRLFYKYCEEEEMITHNPTASILNPELEGKLPHYLQNEQLAELRKLVEGRLQERAVIEVLFATGVRISEMAALKKDDIVWSERIIYVRNGKRKKDRIVLFTRSCEEKLKAYLQERRDDLPFLFVNTTGTGPVCVRTTQLKFDTYARKIGIHLTPHTLRHTFAAHLAIRGMPLVCIQALLGHDKPDQTHLYARLYSHARKQMYDEWM